ncbi:MAG: GAF domain-containing protein [Candidatus Aquicultor sp.]
MIPISNEGRAGSSSKAEPSHLRKDLDTLLSALADISSELDIDSLLPEVMRHATDLCDGDAGTIAIIDRKGAVVRRYPYKAPEAVVSAEIPPNRGALREAIEKRKTIIVNDYPAYPESIEGFVKAGIKAVIVAPIIRKNRIIGVMEVISFSGKKRFSGHQATLLEAVARQTAVAIENARLYETLRESTGELTRRSKDLQALLGVALDITSGLKLDELMRKIASNATELTGADAGAVGLFDEERGVVTYPFIYNLPEILSKVDVPLGESMSGLVISQKKSLMLDDYQQLPQRMQIFAEAGLRAILMIPLTQRGKIIGTLWVSSKNPEKKFDERDGTILEGIGRQAAIALENARLFANAEQKTKSLSRLFEISQTISAGLNLDEVFKRAVSAIKSVFDVSAAWIAIYDEASGSVRIAEYQGPSRDTILKTVVERPYSGLDEYAIAEKKPQIANDIPSDPRIANKEQALKLGARSMISIPIISKGKSIGALGVGALFPTETPKGKEQLEFFEAIAATVAIAIDNARLFESVKASEKEARRRARELSILNNLSNVLSQTLELDTVLNTAIDSILELLEADAAAIFFLVEERQVLEMIKHRGVSDYFVKNSFEIPVGERLPGAVVESGGPIIIEDLAKYPEFEASVVYEAFKSLVGAPIKSKNQIIGVLALGSRQVGKFKERDATLLESIGNELGIAIENSRLFEAQRNISDALQHSMLPTYIPDIPGIEIGVRYSSATEEAVVGGDFYDIYDVNGGYALVIGDVSGKGIEAASSTSMMKYVLRAYLYQDHSPAQAMTETNKFIKRQVERAVFITTFCAVYDPTTGLLTFTNAGHPYPCLLDQTQRTCIVMATNDPAVGILDIYDYRENTVVMNPGTLLVSYTDGVLEARSPDGEFFGEERLVETLLQVIDFSAQKIADSILDAAFEFSHGHLTDDIAILVTRRI